MQTFLAVKPPIDWSSPTLWGLLGIHAAGLAGLALVCCGLLEVSSEVWAVAAFLAIGRGVAIGAGYHRYFAHRTYKLVRWKRATQLLMAMAGSSAAQGGVIWWAGVHRDHHRFTDEEGDPHSPKLGGYWWAHMGWMFAKKFVYQSNTSDLSRYPELRWMEKWHWLFPVALALACLLAGGLSGLLIGFFLSTTLLYQSTFLVNSACHSSEDEKDTSRNCWWMSFLMPVGEQWHANHHKSPWSARSGEKWWQVDLSFYWLALLHWIGHIQLKPAPG